ncbi:hypothetical protein C8J57DRAFT_1281629 [Mycena rebaudengoi]|nr:hypothetical protein C8J57DRAFT_1281629 [Mycena rebaudengoi]
MILSTILSNPRARVYNLRFLLLAAIACTALHAYNRVHWRHNKNSIPLWLSMFFSLFVPVHHLAVLFRWPDNWLAINDLAISTIEIGVTGNIVYYIYDNKEMKLDTQGRICDQQFDFFGGCALVKPAYTPWTILHHRSPVIVAFIRDRLGEDPQASTEKGEHGDVETQITSPTCDAVERGAYNDAQTTEVTRGPGTASEKTPLLGVI